MAKKAIIGGLLVATFLGAYVLDTASGAGVFRDIQPHFAGTCTAIEGVAGIEDIVLDSAGIAYLIGDERRLWAATGHGPGGRIYLYRAGSYAPPVALPYAINWPFHPHGASLYESPDESPDRLFVVNHPNEADGRLEAGSVTSQIEIFDITETGLQYRKSFMPNENFSMNDVAATGPESFYASVDRGSTSNLGRMAETWLRLARAGVAAPVGDKAHQVLDGLTYANGVALSGDGKTLFVSETTGHRLIAYAVGADGGLAEIASVKLESGLDNITVAADGSLWIAAHPKLFAFLAHAKDGSKRSPSEIYRVPFDGEKFGAPESLYLNDGDPISGASVAVPYGDGGFLIGSVFDPRILDCQRDQ